MVSSSAPEARRPSGSTASALTEYGWPSSRSSPGRFWRPRAGWCCRESPRRGGRRQHGERADPSVWPSSRINSAPGGVRLARQVRIAGGTTSFALPRKSRRQRLGTSIGREVVVGADAYRARRSQRSAAASGRSDPAASPCAELFVIRDQRLRAIESLPASPAAKPDRAKGRRAPHARPPPSRCAGR